MHTSSTFFIRSFVSKGEAFQISFPALKPDEIKTLAKQVDESLRFEMILVDSLPSSVLTCISHSFKD